MSTGEPTTREPNRLDLKDHALGAGIGAVYVGWLLSTARGLGFARDEGFYFNACSHYARWFQVLFDTPKRALERASIDASWSANHEHPSLMKSFFALSWMFLHEKWKVFHDASTAYRFPGMVMMGLCLYVTYVFAAQAYSRRAGLVAAVLLGLAPNMFYNAHLACFDVPIMAMWTCAIYMYWLAERKGGGYAIWAGIVYGLTLETKHNAWMMPAVVLPHAVMLHFKDLRSGAKGSTIPVPTSLLSMALIGPVVFVGLWPWLWNDTLPRVQEYVNFHMNHEYYNIEFRGKDYFAPPSPPAYAPTLIFATVPTITVLLFLIGAVETKRGIVSRLLSPLLALRNIKLPKFFERGVAADPFQTDLLILLGFAVPISVFFLPRTPIFGGTKHWFPAYPFMAILAGRGFDLAFEACRSIVQARFPAVTERTLQTAMLLMITAGPALITRHSHPFGLSTYVPFVGGTQGGADLGFNRQFWGFTTESLGPYFEKNAPKGATVFIHDTAWDSWARLVDEKRVPPTLRAVASPSEAQFSIVHHELHMAEVDYNIWMAYGKSTPDFVLTHDGVPIISVYRRDDRIR